MIVLVQFEFESCCIFNDNYLELCCLVLVNVLCCGVQCGEFWEDVDFNLVFDLLYVFVLQCLLIGSVDIDECQIQF